MTDEQTNPSASRRKTVLAATAAVVVLGAIGIFFVLPAETGIDPTGFGETSGLSEMANPQAGEFLERGRNRKGTFTPTAAPPEAEPGKTDHWTFELHPYQEIELKYVLDKDAPITFAWRADGPLNFDMHAHPFAGGEALTESYAVDKADRQSGRYVAPFAGIHGWHWQNRTMNTVKLTLDASGKITGSKLLDGRGEKDRELMPEPQ